MRPSNIIRDLPPTVRPRVDYAHLTDAGLAEQIRTEHRAGGDAAGAMTEAARRGIKPTVTIRRVSVHLLSGEPPTDEGTRQVAKHPLDVAAELEARP